MKTLPIFVIAALFFAAPFASADWLAGGYAFRRPIDANWDNDTAGDQLCVADFYVAGHAQPAGADIRVATPDGKAVATRVLQFGPGDHVEICFPLIKDNSKYYVYFGNPAKPVPAPAMKTGPDHVPADAGLLLDMRVFNGGRVRDAADVQRAWEQSGPQIGQTIIDKPFLGVNPFGPQVETISKLTGVLTAPDDGDYILAAWADRVGSIEIDGKPTLFVRLGPGDTRQRTTIHLTKGRHDFVLYNANRGVPGAYSVVWQKPNTTNFEELPASAFGQVHHAEVGPLEELHKTLVADFDIEYQGECFFADGYSQRYHFIARDVGNADAKYEWDFGDGQTFVGQNISHVFVLEGEYPIKLTVRIGGNSDTETNKLLVTRDWAHLDHPPEDNLQGESDTVAKYYNLDTIPADWLPRVCWLHERAGDVDPALAAAARLAALPRHRDANEAMRALQDVTRLALSRGKADAVEALWRSVPDSSDLQPRAREQLAQLLLWRSGEFDAVVRLLSPFAQAGDATLRRLYGEALVLDQKPDEGGKELKAIPAAVIGARAPAVSGALARTIEFYIRTGDWEAGQDAWEDWQQQFPADFLEGYSVMLQTRLMEQKGAPSAAAKVAEAFALAEPASSYAPQLLDRASKLLAKSDPAKSASLHQLLKQKYPEDPLSQ